MEAGLAFSSFPGSIGHLLPCPAPPALLQRAPSPPTTPHLPHYCLFVDEGCLTEDVQQVKV